MSLVAGPIGLVLIAIILWDCFETVILPRRVTRKFRLTAIFFRWTWRGWSALAKLIRKPKLRERYLSVYGPLSMLVLLGVWATGLIFSFAFLHYALGSAVNLSGTHPTFATDLYLSGTTFFTLGLGDVTPRSGAARLLTVLESGMGFGFLAVVIGYLPTLYNSFSRRESDISLLDARAGSPPTAAELIRRHSQYQGLGDLQQLLQNWERWAAELLESHISYPVLCYFRSQHDNQSWLGSLTAILDVCAVVTTGIDDVPPWQAKLTFAMARHAVVDLAQILNTPPVPTDRLSASDWAALRKSFQTTGLALRDEAAFPERLAELRYMYEPYVAALAGCLLVTLPPWIRSKPAVDNWRTSAWEHSSSGLSSSRLFDPAEDDHFR